MEVYDCAQCKLQPTRSSYPHFSNILSRHTLHTFEPQSCIIETVLTHIISIMEKSQSLQVTNLCISNIESVKEIQRSNNCFIVQCLEQNTPVRLFETFGTTRLRRGCYNYCVTPGLSHNTYYYCLVSTRCAMVTEGVF